MAYSLYLFIRDIADGDLVAWVDDRLDQSDELNSPDRVNALIEPLRNVYGVSDKVLALGLSDILIGAADVRPAWLDIGVQLIAVDTLVHNFLHRGRRQTRTGSGCLGLYGGGPSGAAASDGGIERDAETVTAFFEDMKRRGLNDPLLVTSDGAPGIIKAIEVCFPRASRQRCLAHRMRNLAVKVPEDVWPEFKVRVQAAYQAPSRAIARDLAAGIVADYGRKHDNAVACFTDDFEACIAHLRFPVTHRRAIRTTNLLERLFVEERRRLKIIPNAFGERAVLKLMFGALTRAAERWKSIKFSEFDAVSSRP